MASNTTVSSAKEPVTNTCHLCDNEANVNWYCNDCEEVLCDRCMEAHRRGRKTKNDDVVSIDNANHVHPGDKPVPEVCKQHPENLREMYCCDCDVLVCLKCFSEAHPQHNWKNFEDAVTVKQQQLKEQMTFISSTLDQLQTVMSQKQRATEASSDNYGNTGAEVNFQRNKIKAEIDAIADAVLDELSKIEKEETEKREKHCEKSEKKIAELTKLIEKLEMSDKWRFSQFVKMNRYLKMTLPQYDDSEDEMLPQLPTYVAGNIERSILSAMVGQFTPQEPTQDDGNQE